MLFKLSGTKLPVKQFLLIAVLLYAMLCPGFCQLSLKPAPRLEKRGEATQLIVDGKPFLVLGGELHNSNASDLNYLRPLLKQYATMQMNTVLAPVYWDMMEPVENKFDFSLVDGLLTQARESKLKVILLWFGSWKNGMSHYAPIWIKKNLTRFPRVKIANGKHVEIMSPFSAENLKADTKAFVALMNHVKAIDSRERTVIMVQVENEIGIHGDSRDRSDAANAHFAAEVPVELMNGLKRYQLELQPELKTAWGKAGYPTNGTWEEVFGKETMADDVFMAWYFASYTNKIATAGKLAYNIPMFVNAWITPGYPRGGPVANMHDVWRVGAPMIDLLTPDLYPVNFRSIAPAYTHEWNPLFVPESISDSAGASNVFYAFGKLKAIGYSPFAPEDRVLDKINGPLPLAYKAITEMAPVILAAQSNGSITAVSVNEDAPVERISFGGYNLEVQARRKKMFNEKFTPGSAYAIIIASAPDEFIIAGVNVEISFSPATPGPKIAGIASVWEGKYQNGKWIPGRKLNGGNMTKNYAIREESDKDQTGTVARLENAGPAFLKLSLYRFE